MFPDNFAVLVVGSPTAGMNEFCCYVAATHLSADDNMVFVESNTHADNVRSQLQLFGIDPLDFENRNKLVFIDCFGSAGTREVDEKSIKVVDVTNLEEIIQRVEEGILKVGGPPVNVLFDSITPLYMHHDSNEVGKFFSALSSMVKVSGKITSTVHNTIVPEEQIALLSTIADGVIEIKVDEGFHRFVRIKHFKGIDVNPKWVPFDFEREQDEDSAVLGWRSPLEQR
jgi:KaiC/GvpD/RAD55 family RecA-like ATPase